MNSLLSFVLLYLLPIQIISVEVPPFSQTNVAVYFDPFVAVNDNSETVYSASELIWMVSKISTRFGKIMSPPIDENIEMELLSQSLYISDFVYQYIPTAVAQYNRKHLKPTRQPIELLLPFTLSVLRNGTSSNFDIAKRLADEANDIYPGTVKWIYMVYYDLSDDNVEEVKRHLIYIHTKTSGTEYKLGAFLPWEGCGTDWFLLPKYFSVIVPYIQEIIFSSYSKEDYFIGEPHLASLYITGYFERYVRKLQTHNQNISTQLFTSWKYTNTTDIVTHNKKLVKYWISINDWATKSNVSVVFNRAFDTPFAGQAIGNSGWWKLIENSSYRNSSDYVFEEKINPIKQAPEMDVEGTNTTQTWPIVVGVALLIFIIVLITSVIFWKPLRSRLEENGLKQEVNVFYEGTSHVLGGSGMLGALTQICQAPYNRDLELSKSQFTVDMNKLLGSGAFGAVYEGTVTRENLSEGKLTVAVKTTMRLSPSTARASLLSEIKILSYLGKQDNLVNIIGAYTKGIKKGKLYVFLEFCKLGSLEKHLREKISLPQQELDIDQKTQVGNEEYYQDLTSSDDIRAHKKLAEELSEYRHTKLTSDKIVADASDLQRWGLEIANGMEFLASKNVVHVDLATRNVLLTLDKHAKISDFGLSRRLYDYEMYVKTQQEPLPWRWMAPESHRRMEFNEKTDVWAFGVTLWEIYSLGDVPFGGLSWTPNFVTQIAQGLRLQEPSFHVNGLYSMMLKCWNMDPSKRPTFSELKLLLQDLDNVN